MFSFIKSIFQCRAVSSKLNLQMSENIFISHSFLYDSWTEYRILGWQFLILSIFPTPFSLFITLINLLPTFSLYPPYTNEPGFHLIIPLSFILDYYLRSSVLKIHYFFLWPWKGYYSNFHWVFKFSLLYFLFLEFSYALFDNSIFCHMVLFIFSWWLFLL